MADQIQCLLRLNDSYWANCLCGLGYSSVTQQKSRITYILRLRERQITSFHIFKTPFNFMLCQCFGVDGAFFFFGGGGGTMSTRRIFSSCDMKTFMEVI